MPVFKKRLDFFNSPEGLDAKKLLDQMFMDETYNTSVSYSANTALYPDNLIPFIDKHMDFLFQHPSVDVYSYISNLRLMTRQR